MKSGKNINCPILAYIKFMTNIVDENKGYNY